MGRRARTMTDENQVVQMENEDAIVEVDLKERRPLDLGPLPIGCTVSVFDDKLLLDPTDEEEECSEACVTVVLCKVKTDNELCHVHKPGGIGISPEKLQQFSRSVWKN